MQIRTIYSSLHPTLKNDEKFVLASDWPRPQIDQNPKFYFQVHNEHTQTILWNLSRDIEKKQSRAIRHQFRVDRPSKF